VGGATGSNSAGSSWLSPLSPSPYTRSGVIAKMNY